MDRASETIQGRDGLATVRVRIKTADGFEEAPCPYGPHWPTLDEFDFIARQDNDLWVCYAVGKTKRSRQVRLYQEIGKTKEEAEERARNAAAPKTKAQTPNA